MSQHSDKVNLEKRHEIMDQKLRHQHIATVTDKKKDPNYGLLRGLIPQDLLKKFKIYCIENDIDNSQGLENLLREYFEWKDQQAKSSKAQNSKKEK